MFFQKSNNNIKNGQTGFAKTKSYVAVFLIICFAVGLGAPVGVRADSVTDSFVNAGMLPPTPAVNTADAATGANTQGDWMATVKGFLKEEVWDKMVLDWNKAWSTALNKAMTNAVNKIAYDAATYIGSGGKGQNPMFIREGWGEYMSNLGDEAFGDFVEGLGKDFPINLCNPSIGVKMKIGLGLQAQTRPKAPACTFKKMAANWEKSLDSANFLNNFRDYFDPTSNDLGVAFTLHVEAKKVVLEKKEAGKLFRIGYNNWVDVDGYDDRLDGPPNDQERVIDQASHILSGNIGNWTGNALIDAANVFLNQLAITLFNRLIAKIGAGGANTTSPHPGISWLDDYDSQGPRSDISGTREYLNEIIQPNFTVRGDYEVLSNLTICPDPTKAGPTECVITDNMQQAITERKTVGEALEVGYLNPNGTFGFVSGDIEPSYKEGYPYRSMIILRKFRILPVGWELAAENIKNNKRTSFSLKDMVDCFDENDSGYQGYFEDWCEGLVDPDWVLKAPLNYCKLEGPGPQIIADRIIGRGTDSSRQITRNDNYCADEQACIKELDDGSCQAYGYCVEERRTWNFDAESCEPIFNSCKSFKKPGGDFVSYLTNTLESCKKNAVGCKEYETIGVYDAEEQIVNWNDRSPIFLNQNIQSCTEDAEGCHEFIRNPGKYNEEVVYQKLLPNYLASTCYKGGGDGIPVNEYYNYKEDLDSITDSICKEYVRKCNEVEVGCELYTDVARDEKIPAKVVEQNYCPVECVGFDEYIQKPTHFESKALVSFVPAYASTCSLDMVGCDEFTNLDEIAGGGEGREYYVELKQCVDPEEPEGASCSSFYLWEQLSSGPQLRVFNLKAESGGAPATIDNLGLCESVYNLPLTDPNYNPDCREFLDVMGKKHYRLLSQTITCSQDCHTYRRSEKNILLASEFSDTDFINLKDCSKSASKDLQKCKLNIESGVRCVNGGFWSPSQGSCLYRAIPGEGKTCNAASVSCREYSGTQAANVKNIYNNDFEGVLGHEWQRGILKPIDILIDGQSLYDERQVSLVLYEQLSIGQSYILSFYIKPESSSPDIKVVIDDIGNTSEYQLSASENLVKGEWQRYDLAFELTKEQVESIAEQKISIQYLANTTAGLYVDNIQLSKVLDQYHVLKNSFNVPDICHQEWWKLQSSEYPLSSYPYPNYSLGCREYTDRSGAVKYLKEFDEICQETAVGCESMVDTYNLSSTDASMIWNDNNKDGVCGRAERSCAQVAANNYTYVVYDPEKMCNDLDKGCERLGLRADILDKQFYTDTYLRNNPDLYNQTLCSADDIGCESWIGDDSSTFFYKDPQTNVCEWRDGVNGSSWYKKSVKRCQSGDDKDNICRTNNDCRNENLGIACSNIVACDVGSCVNGTCQSKIECVLDNTDDLCETDVLAPKTFGEGGYGSRVEQPEQGAGWAGLCPLDESGCTEYVDQSSQFNSNLIFNPKAEVISGVEYAGWDDRGNLISQDINVDPFTIYLATGLQRIECSGDLWEFKSLDDNNEPFNKLLKFELGDVMEINVANTLRFYTSSEAVKCTVTKSKSPKVETIVRELAVEYRKADKLDREFCDGIVDFDKGCVLFNERSWIGDSVNEMIFDGDSSIDGKAPAVCNGANKVNCDSNAIIHVSPNRVCGEWLACRSKAEVENSSGEMETVCLDVGACSSMDENGNCDNFVIKESVNQQLINVKSQLNALSGYSKVGYTASTLINDYYLLGAMDQVGELARVSNGDFELYGYNKNPIGWILGNQTAAGEAWNKNIFSVVSSHVQASEVEKIGYAPSGNAFLKLGSTHSTVSELIDVEPNTDYVLTGYVNTQNLQTGNVQIRVLDRSGNNLLIINQPIGMPWSFKVAKFTTLSNTSQIKIKLSAQYAPKGNFYFDNIQLRPALASRDNWFTPQTCRLYPESDALSCDYFEDSGTRQKGLYGYCLEYDRAPGDSNSCLLWYPIDRVMGDWIDEGAGYNGKYPVHYCTQFKSGVVVEARLTEMIVSDCVCGDSGEPSINLDGTTGSSIPPGYKITKKVCNKSCSSGTWGGRNETAYIKYLTPTGSDIAYGGKNYNWYEYNGDLASFSSSWGGNWDEGDKGLKLYYDKGLHEQEELICEQIVNTVSSSGQNKAWLGNVYEGSSYKVIGLGYQYSAENDVFGSVLPPYTLGKVNEWDGSTKDGNQPLPLFVANSTGVNAGFPHRCVGDYCNYFGLCSKTRKICYKPYSGTKYMCDVDESCGDFPTGQVTDRIKRLFAQSYGSWTWNGSNYEQIDDVSWSSPTSKCSGGVRPSYSSSSSADYCAVLPTISNIKVNDSAESIVLSTETQMVNLTFNTDVDENQMPMVMMSIGWGDGEVSVVTGTSMRDMAGDKQHSFYHLYGYWDLKSKVAQGVAGIDCSSVAGQCSVKPKVKIKDNWGWCNGGTSMNDCDQWEEFDGGITVYEK